jgi:hypothetical protein
VAAGAPERQRRPDLSKRSRWNTTDTVEFLINLAVVSKVV